MFGIKRSGNHPIIHWLLRHAGRRCVQLNDTKGVDAYATCWNVFTRGLAPWRCQRGARNLLKTVGGAGEVNCKRSDESVDWDYLREYSPKDCLMISYEELMPDSDLRARYKQQHDELVGPSGECHEVLVLRDAFNLFASLYRSPFGRPEFIRRCAAIYKRCAELFLDERRQAELGVVCANYNRWVVSAPYRIELAAKLGISVDGSPFLDVPIAGGGSSFDGRMKHGDAQDMKVFERWKVYRRDPRYREIFDDGRLVELSDAVFGEVLQ